MRSFDIGVALGRPPDPAVVDRVRQTRIQTKAAVFARIELEVLAAATDLNDHQTRLAVLSNCFAEDVTAWADGPLARLFDCTVFSFQEGLAKPDSAVYELACRRLGVRPADAVFVGDGGHEELTGAAPAGLPYVSGSVVLAPLAAFPPKCSAQRSPSPESHSRRPRCEPRNMGQAEGV